MRRTVFWFAQLLLISLCFLPWQAGAQDAFRGTVTEVERGDQLSVKLDSWTLRVRLHGIVCPTEGVLKTVAREWTQKRVQARVVQVGVRGTAAQGIVYGDLTYQPDEHNVAIELAEQGLATWAQQYAPRRRDMELAEQRARQAKAGIWGNPDTEAIRLRRLIASMERPAATRVAPASGKKVKPAPPKPAPPRNPSEPRELPELSKGRSRSVWPLAIGIFAAAACLAAAERVSRDARRLRHRPTLIPEVIGQLIPLKVRGTARAQGEQAVSIAGRIPGIYLHEVTQVFRDGAWRTTYNETDTIPFVLDDGMGQLAVPLERVRYKPIRVARFYNDIPVEKWHARSYGGDIRTEVFFIPGDVTLTLYGVFEPNHPSPLLVIEGDERRLTYNPVRLAMLLIVMAVGALLLGTYFMILGAGLP